MIMKISEIKEAFKFGGNGRLQKDYNQFFVSYLRKYGLESYVYSESPHKMYFRNIITNEKLMLERVPENLDNIRKALIQIIRRIGTMDEFEALKLELEDINIKNTEVKENEKTN
jgi:hypothetical protein